MDYNPINIPSDRSQQGQYYSTVVGAYDRWAIRYGYTVVDGEVSGVQPPALAAIAALGGQAKGGLAFATDEDRPRSDGIDPFASTWDLGDDPIAFHADRLALAQNLLREAANRTVQVGESWTLQHHAVRAFMRTALSSGTYLAKYVGGVVFARAHRGAATPAVSAADDPVAPAPPLEQARAVTLALQIVSGDFWMPAAEAMRRLPKRTAGGGAGCADPALEEYCLGLAPPALLEEAGRIRRLVLMALLQPSRTRGLALAEFMAEALEEGDDELGEEGPPSASPSSPPVPPLPPPPPPPPPPPASPEVAVWLEAPPSLGDALGALGRAPSVDALFCSIHAALALPPVATLGQEGRSAGRTRYELQRLWLALLASYTTSPSVGEEAAAATVLLAAVAREMGAIDPTTIDTRVLRTGTSPATWPGQLPRATSGHVPWACPTGPASVHLHGNKVTAAAVSLKKHCDTVAHLVSLWSKGVQLPMP